VSLAERRELLVRLGRKQNGSSSTVIAAVRTISLTCTVQAIHDIADGLRDAWCVPDVHLPAGADGAGANATRRSVPCSETRRVYRDRSKLCNVSRAMIYMSYCDCSAVAGSRRPSSSACRGGSEHGECAGADATITRGNADPVKHGSGHVPTDVRVLLPDSAAPAPANFAVAAIARLLASGQRGRTLPTCPARHVRRGTAGTVLAQSCSIVHWTFGRGAHSGATGAGSQDIQACRKPRRGQCDCPCSSSPPKGKRSIAQQEQEDLIQDSHGVQNQSRPGTAVNRPLCVPRLGPGRTTNYRNRARSAYLLVSHPRRT
jgi:hypothetical protein